MSESKTGRCFCGAVTFEVVGSAAMAGYCHCTDCAAWAGAPVNAFSLFPADAVTVTGGEDQIGTFNRTPGSSRKFCRGCGGHLMTDHPAMGMVDVYHNVVDGLGHNPTMHIFYDEATMSVPDDLPKHAGMPGA